MNNLNDQHMFLARRQLLEQQYFNNVDLNDIIKSISSVDITTIDLCNRTCVFCPRANPKIYPNRNLRMTAQGAEIIADRLSEIKYSGTVAISGFGENLLNPEIVEIIKVIKVKNPTAFVECNTNGDPLDRELIDQLLESNLDCLNINLYDGPEQLEKFDSMLGGIDKQKYKYRVHWNPDDYGIIFNNRTGLVKMIDDTSNFEKVKNTKCYLPFYKLYIDWNGDVLFCANDWGRTRVVGNVFQQPIKEIWLSKEMLKVRMRLSKANRNFKPCDKCNVIGTLVGEKSFNMLMEHYENSSNRNE